MSFADGSGPQQRWPIAEKGADPSELWKSAAAAQKFYWCSEWIHQLKRAKKPFPPCASERRISNPLLIFKNSSILVLKFLYEYYKIGKKDVENDPTGCMVQDLRILYEGHSHIESCIVNQSSVEARAQSDTCEARGHDYQS